MRSDRLLVMLMALATVVASAPLAAQTGGEAALHEMRWGRATFVLTEVLEYAPGLEDRPLLFDVVVWSGGSINRLWLKADGDLDTEGRGSSGEFQALYGRLVSPFWDAQFGVRVDVQSAVGITASRAGAVLGLQGLAPNWFEVEPSLFVTTDGNVSAQLTSSYDLYLTQRLVLQPRLEANVAVQEDREFGLGSGLTSGSFALRTRFEFRREFAPYLGVLWERRFGQTADLARAAGRTPGEAILVVGLRLWR